MQWWSDFLDGLCVNLLRWSLKPSIECFSTCIATRVNLLRWSLKLGADLKKAINALCKFTPLEFETALLIRSFLLLMSVNLLRWSLKLITGRRIERFCGV